MRAEALIDAVLAESFKDAPMGEAERAAIVSTLHAGQQFGFGNLMAWLATAWAVHLRDAGGIKEKDALEAVSGRWPYPLPAAARIKKGGRK